MKRERNSSYEEWLKETGKNDTKLNRDWYNASEDKRSDYIKKHKS